MCEHFDLNLITEWIINFHSNDSFNFIFKRYWIHPCMKRSQKAKEDTEKFLFKEFLLHFNFIFIWPFRQGNLNWTLKVHEKSKKLFNLLSNYSLPFRVIIRIISSLKHLEKLRSKKSINLKRKIWILILMEKFLEKKRKIDN